MGDLEAFEPMLARVREAVDATYRGNAEPYIALWSRREPVSLFGALGPRKTAMADIERAFRWVASRFGDPLVSTEFEVVEVGDNFAYTVGYEQGELAIDGVKQQMRIRVTQIYRREEDEWRLVHRHGDFAPVDDSPGAGTRPGHRKLPDDSKPVVLIARFDGNVEQLRQAYDLAHERLKNQPGPAAGELRHHCAMGDNALYLVGIWESERRARERFASDEFEHTLVSAGFPSPKKADLTILELHATEPAL